MLRGSRPRASFRDYGEKWGDRRESNPPDASHSRVPKPIGHGHHKKTGGAGDGADAACRYGAARSQRRATPSRLTSREIGHFDARVRRSLS